MDDKVDNSPNVWASVDYNDISASFMFGTSLPSIIENGMLIIYHQGQKIFGQKVLVFHTSKTIESSNFYKIWINSLNCIHPGF